MKIAAFSYTLKIKIQNLFEMIPGAKDVLSEELIDNHDAI